VLHKFRRGAQAGQACARCEYGRTASTARPRLTQRCRLARERTPQRTTTTSDAGQRFEERWPTTSRARDSAGPQHMAQWPGRVACTHGSAAWHDMCLRQQRTTARTRRRKRRCRATAMRQRLVERRRGQRLAEARPGSGRGLGQGQVHATGLTFRHVPHECRSRDYKEVSSRVKELRTSFRRQGETVKNREDTMPLTLQCQGTGALTCTA
jgi:hypothetical protein